jgi:DNA-binding transcriptional ArsR family regulator
MIRKRVEQLSALGQEDRLQIFRMLVRAGPQGNCVDEIKRRFKMPGSTLSHHLDALTRSGLLSAQRSGRFIYYAIDWRETANLLRFLSEDCCADMHTKLTQTVGSSALELSIDNKDACCGEGAIVAHRPSRRVCLKRPVAANRAKSNFED